MNGRPVHKLFYQRVNLDLILRPLIFMDKSARACYCTCRCVGIHHRLCPSCLRGRCPGCLFAAPGAAGLLLLRLLVIVFDFLLLITQDVNFSTILNGTAQSALDNLNGRPVLKPFYQRVDLDLILRPLILDKSARACCCTCRCVGNSTCWQGR